MKSASTAKNTLSSGGKCSPVGLKDSRPSNGDRNQSAK